MPNSSGNHHRNTSNKPNCPLLNIVGASEHGIVLESDRGFELGDSIALGFHVNSSCGLRESKFISAESIVVESHPQETDTDGEILHQVTVLFSEISREDRQALMQMPEAVFSKLSTTRSEEEQTSSLYAGLN